MLELGLSGSVRGVQQWTSLPRTSVEGGQLPSYQLRSRSRKAPSKGDKVAADNFW